MMESVGSVTGVDQTRIRGVIEAGAKGEQEGTLMIHERFGGGNSGK